MRFMRDVVRGCLLAATFFVVVYATVGVARMASFHVDGALLKQRHVELRELERLRHSNESALEKQKFNSNARLLMGVYRLADDWVKALVDAVAHGRGALQRLNR